MVTDELTGSSTTSLVRHCFPTVFQRSPLATKNAFFWDVARCGSCKNRRFGETYRLDHRYHENRRARKFLRGLLQLLITANVVPCSLILFTLMMGAIRSFEMPALIRATQRHIPEDGILHSTISCSIIYYLMMAQNGRNL
jgi:hypothetical protein